jgi:hypothetical protein
MRKERVHYTRKETKYTCKTLSREVVQYQYVKKEKCVETWREIDLLQFILAQFSRSFALQPSDQNCAVEIVSYDFVTVLIWTVRSTIDGPDSK